MNFVRFKASLVTTFFLLNTFACSAVKTNTQTLPMNNAVTVDAEMRTPEGSAYADSIIYEEKNGEYKSSTRTISKVLIDEIRKTAIESESKTKPDLRDFGITPESVQQNKDLMVTSAYTPFGRNKPAKVVTYENLAPELKNIFDYETVSQNALKTITGSMNSEYECVRFFLPGDPPIVLLSRRHQSDMLPWRVQVGDKVWNSYSRELPKALAKISQEHLAHRLNDDTPDLWFQQMIGKSKVFWPDGFFAQYGSWSGDQVQSYEAIQAAKKLPGFSVASKMLIIEDAIDKEDGEFSLQVKITKPGCVIDRVRFLIEPKTKEESAKPHDWTDFINWYQALELSAQSLDWLKKWKSEKPERSAMAFREYFEISDNNELKALWTHLAFDDKPAYSLRLMENDVHVRDAFIGSSFKNSVITDLGPYGGATARLPKAMKRESSSVLRTHENGHDDLKERIIAVLDNSGKILKQGKVPPNYALRGDAPFPEAQECEFDYSWPVDFNQSEDLVYLDDRSKDEGEIESVMPADFRDEALFGLANKNGKIVLKPEWKYIGPFSNGLALIQSQSKTFGFINQDGQTIVNPDYQNAETFYEGLAAVRKDGKWGFIDPGGKIVIPFKFDFVHRFSEGLAPAKYGTKFGYIDKTGKFVIEPKFARARHFQNGLAYVQVDGKRAYINKSGQPIGGNYYDRLERFADKRALYAINRKVGFIDSEGNQVIPAEFDDAKAFRDGIATVRIGNDAKGIDINGKFVQNPAPHSDFWDGPIKDGLVRISKEEKCDRKYGFGDRFGKVIIKPIYDNVGIFSEGLCPVELNGKHGVIDKTGKFVIPAKYEHLASSFEEKRIAFYQNGKHGLLDDQGKIVLEPTYSHIFPFKNGIALTQNGVKYGYIDINGKVIFEPQFDTAGRFGTMGLAQIGSRINKLEEVKLP